MLTSIAILLGGLVLLAVAADRFVLSAARLSRAWGLSPVLVGALVVGMGTSAPELLVSILAALDGDLNLALGNAVGSNVANVTLVVGIAALVHPLTGTLQVLQREGALMFVAVCGFAYVMWDREVTRLEGSILAGAMVIAALLVVRWAKLDKNSAMETAPRSGDDVKVTRELIVGLVALGLTMVGAQMLVEGGSALAAALGVGSSFVGMTLVAVGTSLPELATSVAGVRRGEFDIVLGNVVGSNLFNALAVGGAAGILAPGTVEPNLLVGVIGMVGFAALAGILARTGRTVVRWEGAMLLLGFVAFVVVSYDPSRVGL
jgi:cation:H+ antiporter